MGMGLNKVEFEKYYIFQSVYNSNKMYLKRDYSVNIPIEYYGIQYIELDLWINSYHRWELFE